jgi:hypothetical protein
VRFRAGNDGNFYKLVQGEVESWFFTKIAGLLGELRHLDEFNFAQNRSSYWHLQLPSFCNCRCQTHVRGFCGIFPEPNFPVSLRSGDHGPIEFELNTVVREYRISWEKTIADLTELAKLRWERKWTEARIAEHLGVSYNSVHMRLRGLEIMTAGLNTPPEYLVTFEAGIRPLVTAIALGLIWMGATRMEGPAQSRYATAGALSVVLIAWLAVAQYLGSANAYFATRENAVPTVLFGLLIPLMTAAVGLRLSGSFASLLSAIPLHWIVAAQVYRIGGGIFLVLWADGRLPWQFALPAGIGDVMTGCLAVVVAVLLAQKAPGALRAAYGWCLFGIADLVVAVTMGAMTSPGRAHLLAFDAPNLLISSYPLVMVPTFAVPLALMLHGLVLLRLRRESASTGRLAAARCQSPDSGEGGQVSPSSNPRSRGTQPA